MVWESRIERILSHTKADKREITTGTPKTNEMKEGVRYTSLTEQGLTEFIKHNGSLYSKLYSKVEQANAGAMSHPEVTDEIKPTSGSFDLGGFIIKWGVTNGVASSTGHENITFPNPFPTALFTVVLTHAGGANNRGAIYDPDPAVSNREQFHYHTITSSTGAYIDDGLVSWIAIGN